MRSSVATVEPAPAPEPPVEQPDLSRECERLRAALDELRDGVIVVDDTGREVLRNAHALRYQQARHGDALVAEAIDNLLEVAARGERAVRELTLFGPPREVLQIEVRPLNVGSDPAGAVCLVRDVTEMHRIVSVRRDFVANVSHELKTPIGAVEVLAETLAGCDEIVVVRQLAEQLVREAERLARIVDDLLDLSIIEAQELPSRERVPVRIILEESVERLRALALAKGIPLRVAPVADDLVLDCDAARVIGAVTNLLDNAIKYSEPGNPVSVEATRVGDRIELCVADRGIGIPSRDLERIFERFYRVDRARSRATGGTGLGLAIVRHVAAAHGGDVTVESREGEGSTFRLSLPQATNGEHDDEGGS